MKKIKMLSVVYEDGSYERWEGNGVVNVHHTGTAKGPAPSDIHYVSTTLEFKDEEQQ